MINNTPQVAALMVALAVVTVVVHEMLVITTPEMQATMRAAEQWCHSMNGTLGVSRVIGEHGGLHCRAPNGTLLEYQ